MSTTPTPAQKKVKVSGLVKSDSRTFRELPKLGGQPPKVDEPQPNGKFLKVEVALLDDHEDQNRLIYEPDAIRILSELISAGQTDPIRIRQKSNGRFEIIAGHRRKRAAQLLGWSHLDAILVDIDDERASLELLSTNETKEDLGDYERAIGYRKALARNKRLKQTGIARAIGLDRSIITHRMKFFELPEEVLEALGKYPRAYSWHTARALLDILKDSPELVKEVVSGTIKVGAGDWSPATLISTLKQRQKRDINKTKGQSRLTITDKESRTLMTLKSLANSKVEIQLAPGMDQDSFLKKLTQLLRDEAEKDANTLGSKDGSTE